MKTLLAVLLVAAIAAHAEDGYDLWLRYRPIAGESLGEYRQAASEIVPSAPSPTLDIAQSELTRGLSGLLGVNEPISAQPTRNGSVIFGTPRSSPLIAKLGLPLDRVGAEGYVVRSVDYEGHHVTVIAANNDVGVLYGAFHLGPLFEETLRSDTYARGKDSTVARVIDGSLFGYNNTGMAGVANIGSDRNWTASHFDQANWYVFGRLAWNPTLSSRDIAEDWVKMTFSADPTFVAPVVSMMMGSREAAVDYMTPLGLHHQMARTSHYGPEPWVSGGARADWTSVYFNRADEQGIGFDRISAGSDALSQYAQQVAAQYADLRRIPQKYLLWFHHVPWDYRLASERTLWDELVIHYSQGVQTVSDMRKTWAGLAQFVDAEGYAQVSAFLAIQEKEARWWRDASIAYFQTFSHRPLPAGYAPPEHDLQYYESLCFPYAPGSASRPSGSCK